MPLTHAERGRMGGRRTFELYGREHMSTIGRAGFQAITHFASGGRLGALVRLQMWGKLRMRHPTIELTPEEFTELARECGLEE
jgi:hypothetical protein